MDNVPIELQRRILHQLDTESALNAALCSQTWFKLLAPLLPALKHLNISLEIGSCNAHIKYRTEHDTSAVVCQCTSHAESQTALIRELLTQFGENLRSIEIEDNLLNRSSTECIRDYPFHVILRDCNATSLQQLSLHCVDLSSVRIWTLSLLAKYAGLTQVSFEECKFPEELSENLFLRMLTPSFPAIQMLRITNNSMVTDKLAIQMAKKCTRLTELSLRNCPNITAISVVAFCECLAAQTTQPARAGGDEMEQRPTPLVLDLRGTAFDSMQLCRHLHNPLFRCNPSSWHVQPICVNIGFDRKALLLAETERIGGLALQIYVD